MKNDFNDRGSILTIAELAKQLNVKASWIRSQIFKGGIPFLNIGRLIRFDRPSVEKWVRETNAIQSGGRHA